jgi:hypothetical protein
MKRFETDVAVECGRADREEWSALLRLFSDATIYQTWSYGAIRWGSHRLSHLTAKSEGNQPIGIAQVVVMKLPGVKAGIAYVPWGPLWRKGDREDSPDHFGIIIRALKDEYAAKRGLLLRVTPNIFSGSPGQTCHDLLMKEGFRLSPSAPAYRTLRVDLSRPLQEIRKRLDQKWRNQLNRSERNGLTIVDGTSEDFYGVFLKLQKEMQDRKKYNTTIDYEQYGRVQSDLSEDLKMKIVLCRHEGECVTATIATAVGDTGIYLLGATGDKGMKLKSAYLSQWKVIEWLKEKQCAWYDLGGIDPENNPGVYHFKAGMSGEDVCHIGQYELCRNVWSSYFVRYGEMIRSMRKKGRSVRQGQRGE